MIKQEGYLRCYDSSICTHCSWTFSNFLYTSIQNEEAERQMHSECYSYMRGHIVIVN